MRTVTSYVGCDVFVIRSDDGRIWCEVRDLARLRNALGAKVLRAFCQCFLGTDHLRSLIHLMDLNYKHSPPGPALDRNLTSLVLLSCGVTRELAKVLGHLRKLGMRGKLPNSKDWERLEELLTRWNWDPTFYDLRDKLSFHFDDGQVFDRGIEATITAGEVVRAFEGDGPENFRMRDSIGLLVALEGLAMDEATVEKVFKKAWEDLDTLSDAVHKVFVALVEAQRGST